MTTAPFPLVASGGLELVRPWALAGLLAAVPIVLLHLYRRRRVVVPFLPLLEEGVGRGRPLGGWRRVRDAAALAARLLALAAVVLALAGLRPAVAGPPPEDLLLVLDGDVTTAAREADGRSRLEHVLARGRAEVQAAPWARVAAVLVATSPRVLVAPTEDRAGAVAALLAAQRDASPGPGTSDLAEGLRLALAAARPGLPTRVVLVTARAAPEDVLPAGVRLEVRGAGAASEDQGIVAFDVARRPDGAGSTLRLAVRNDAPGPRTRRLGVRVGDAVVHEETLDLPVGGTREVALDVEGPVGGAWLRADLEGGDVLAFNDRAAAWLAAPERPSVLVVHGGEPRPYVRAILEALGERLDVPRSGYVRVEDLPRAPRRDVYLVDGVALPPGTLRAGAWVFLAPLGGDLPFTVGETQREPLVWRTAAESPLVRDLDLSAAYVSRGHPLEAPEARGLAFADGRPVIVEGERAGVRYVGIGLDPELSDLPVRAALPLLVKNALFALARAPVEPLRPLYRVGESLRPRLALPGGPEVDLRAGSLAARVRVAPEGETWRVPPGASGEATLTTGEGATSWTGRTGLLDLDPARTVVPLRPPSAAPPPVPEPEGAEAAWRRGLLLAALVLLLGDLALLRGAAPPRSPPGR